MVPVAKVKVNVVAPLPTERIDAGAAVEDSIRRAADDPAEAWVPASGRVRAKNGNVMKTNRRKR
jgi:hypothetical protein